MSWFDNVDYATYKECVDNGRTYTDWFRNEEGNWTIRYKTVGGVWAQVEEIDEGDGIIVYDVRSSEEPGKVRTIYDYDEALAFAKWLVQ